jgi:hypothetical protein
LTWTVVNSYQRSGNGFVGGLHGGDEYSSWACISLPSCKKLGITHDDTTCFKYSHVKWLFVLLLTHNEVCSESCVGAGPWRISFLGAQFSIETPYTDVSTDGFLLRWERNIFTCEFSNGEDSSSGKYLIFLQDSRFSCCVREHPGASATGLQWNYIEAEHSILVGNWPRTPIP